AELLPELRFRDACPSCIACNSGLSERRRGRKPWQHGHDADAEAGPLRLLVGVACHEALGRFGAGVSAAERRAVECGSTTHDDDAAPWSQWQEQGLFEPVERYPYVCAPVDRKRFPALLMEWRKARRCAGDQGQDVRCIAAG